MAVIYNYNDYTFELNKRTDSIHIKINKLSLNDYYEKNVLLSDLKNVSLEKYFLMIQNCLLKKPNYIIGINEIDDKIELSTTWITELLDLNEKIIFNKFSCDEIDLLKNRINDLEKQIKELKFTDVIQIKEIIREKQEYIIQNVHLGRSHKNIKYFKSTNKINIIEFDKYANEIIFIFDNKKYYDIDFDFIEKFNNLEKITTNIIYFVFTPDFESGTNINRNLKELVIVEYDWHDDNLYFNYDNFNSSKHRPFFNISKKLEYNDYYAPNLECLSINHSDAYGILSQIFHSNNSTNFKFPKLKIIKVSKKCSIRFAYDNHEQISKICSKINIKLDFI